ncbi:cache domain-containing protein [Wukongibacter sp. M2B1]|uniref:cache domain-containing protein n=1 Tax=Wukongibacter sp. M2B1 TaxID=3088895 RepID=UPI003D78C1F5
MEDKKNVFINARNILVSAFLFIIVIPIFTLSFFVNNSTKQEINENFIESTKQQVIRVDEFFTMYLSSLSQDSDFLSKNIFVKQADKTITSYMNKKIDENGHIPMTPSKNGGIESEIYKVFLDYAITHPEVECVYIGTKHGGYIQWPESNLKKNYDPRIRLWYKEIMKNREHVIITSPYYAIATENTPVITTGKIVKNDFNEVIGIQAIDVSLDELTKIVREIKIGKSGYVILTDSKGTILAHPQSPELNFKNIIELNSAKLANINEIETDSLEIELNGKSYFAYIYNSPSIGWKFIAIIEKKELMQSVNRIRTVIYIMAFGLTFIFIAIAVIFSNKFSNPLISAARQLKLIELGDFTKEIPKELLSRKDDLGTFIKSVDSMQSVIRNLMEKVKDSSNTEMNYSKFLADITEQTQTATKQAASAIEQFVKTNEDEARDKELMEKKLEKTTESLQQAQKIGRIGNWEWDIVDDRIWLSKEMYRILGLQSQQSEFTSQTFLRHIHPQNKESIQSVMKFTNHRESFGIELKFIDSNGKEIWLYNSGNVVCDGEWKATHIFGISQDITERKQVLSKLREMNKNLKVMVKKEVEKSRKKDAVIIYQSRLAKMGQMIGHIAHQWKQPLNNINLILSNIKDDYEYNELDKESLEASIYTSKKIVDQMSQTIDDFRYFFKPRKNKEKFSLHNTINFALKLIEESIKLNNIKIGIELVCDSKVYGYSNEFSQVIFNILDNAKDALVKNTIDNKEISIKIYIKYNMAIVEICNNGGCIKENVIQNVFEPYFTTKEEEKGTGIGLYMSKMIIERHMNGKLECENIENGACFKILIPCDGVDQNGE